MRNVYWLASLVCAGMLMAFACEAGAILGKAGDAQRRALRNYAYDLGLAFQVTDDILDVEADPQDTGKDTGKDEAAGKFRPKPDETFARVKPIATAVNTFDYNSHAYYLYAK